MYSKSMIIGSLVLGALASIGRTTEAGNINTSGTTCQNYNASDALDIDYLSSGVRNLNASPREVICSVPRSPLPAGASAQFYVDGSNSSTTTTTCTVYVTSYGGAFVASSSFTAGPGTWDRLVSFAAGAVSTYDYVSLLCTLPGSTAGVLYGITALQP